MNHKFKLLAGPCVIESEKLVFETAEKLKEIADDREVDFYFKASFDKANRTSAASFRGPGLKEGIKLLRNIKEQYGLKIVTDIHEPWQAKPVAEVADIIQIPAFLCRQTDLLAAAAKTGKIVNVKKAQFLAPWDMKHVADKLFEAGNDRIMLCERGTSFGYNTLIVDMTALVEMRKLGCPIIFDATHSVQKPGGNGGSTGGNREYVSYLARAAAAVGIDGLFAEVHPNPEQALSDGPNMIYLDDFPGVLDEVLAVHALTADMEERRKNGRNFTGE